MLMRRWPQLLVAVLVLSSTAAPALAQNYSFDARRIALGGAGGTPNVASDLVEQQRRYKSILVPIGLIKVLSNVRVFYPNREDFDFSRAVEFGTAPLHFVFGRSEDITARSFFRDLVNARLNSDLNSYRDPGGFDGGLITDVEGLVSMTWGKTFMLRQGDRSFQGIYIGAGPYLGSQADFNFDSDFEKVLDGSTNRYVRSASMTVGGGEADQLALDVTGSYRARFPFFESDAPDGARNGMYVMANYHHLQGFRFDDFRAQLQLDTDNDGLLIRNPDLEMPFRLQWHTSNKGVGLSLDFGAAFVINRWDFGAGVSGVANRIKWRDITQHELVLFSLFNGTEFVHTKLPKTDITTTLEMPTTYTADLAYHRDRWSLYNEYSNGLGGTNYRSGLEYRLGKIELRGAGRYANGSWYPSAGAGINLTKSFAVDTAFFGTKTFLEPDSHIGMAVSLRFDKD